jgi:Kef-type K+ transport system membrane component KefB
MFLMGLEVDHGVLTRLDKSSIPIATASIAFPVAMAMSLHFEDPADPRQERILAASGHVGVRPVRGLWKITS